MKRMSVVVLIVLAALTVMFGQFSQRPAVSSGDTANQTIAALEKDARDAVLAGEPAMGDGLLSDDYVSMRMYGREETGKETGAFQFHTNASMLYRSMDASHVQVTLSGDTAVATGHVGVKGKKDGKEFSAVYRYSRVYANRGGKWEMVFTQFTRIPPV